MNALKIAIEGHELSRRLVLKLDRMILKARKAGLSVSVAAVWYVSQYESHSYCTQSCPMNCRGDSYYSAEQRTKGRTLAGVLSRTQRDYSMMNVELKIGERR